MKIEKIKIDQSYVWYYLVKLPTNVISYQQQGQVPTHGLFWKACQQLPILITRQGTVCNLYW